MQMNNQAMDLAVESHYVDIDGVSMHYVAQGQGIPILFLHGIPTSSYLWRNVMPYLARLGRCIAPDLIGMGKSAKPPITYTLSDHIHYIERFIESLNLKNIVLVMHDWGSIIGFNYAMHHETNCRGLIFYESFLTPLAASKMTLPYQVQLQQLLQKHNLLAQDSDAAACVKDMLYQSTLRPLLADELERYCEPFSVKGSGKPIYQYLREVTQEQDKVNQIINSYINHLTKSTLPKLMLYAMPGFITSMSDVMWAKEHLSNLEVVDVGEAMHYAQETNPIMMGETMSVWLQGIEQNRGLR